MPNRRSRRNREESEYGLLRDKKRQRRISTLSDLSSPSAPDWPELVSKARARVDKFSPTGSMRNSDKLVKTLHAFLDFLPQKGQLSIARGINLCGEDDAKLFDVFENLCTTLLIPSTSKTFREVWPILIVRYAVKANSASASVTNSPQSKRQEEVSLVASQLDSPSTRLSVFHDTMLRRHDHRCAITQALDIARWEELGEPENDTKGPLEAARIIPFFSFASYRDQDVCLAPTCIMMVLSTNYLSAPSQEASETRATLYR